jgi:hypothetical protein
VPVVFVVLASIHTWPLARNPAHLSRVDNGDAMLNMWAIAWVAHQWPRDPLHLFEANIFYPEHLTLAYSEAMVVQGALATPIIAAGGSPVLAYNLVLLAGLALTGSAFCLLIKRWTGSWGAGYTAGSLAAFNPQVLVRLPHLQAQHVEFIALILFASDRVIVRCRWRDAVWLGVSFALQGLTSIYLLVFSTWMLLFAVLARASEWLRANPIQVLSRFLVAAVTASILLGPYLLPYVEVFFKAGFERTVIDNQLLAASWVDYLSTPSRMHYDLWSHRFFDDSLSPTFPGVLALTLVVQALTWRATRQDARVRMAVVGAIGCAIVSMMPNAPGFPTLYRLVPLFRAVRVEAHLGQMVLLMIAIVAGFAVSELGRRWPHPKTWPLVAFAVCALVNFEALAAPLEFREFGRIPQIYSVLAHEPGAVVVELPFYPPVLFGGNAGYMLNSTLNWRPLLNGYSGFRPASYDETYAAIEGFPSEASIAALRHRGVTDIIVHKNAFRLPAGVEPLARNPSLSLIAASGDVEIYRLKSASF